jgi:hypothetical protein
VTPAVFLEQPNESSRGPQSAEPIFEPVQQIRLSQYLFIYMFLSSSVFPMFCLSLLTYIFLSTNIRTTVRRKATYHLPTTRHDSPSVCTRECRLASTWNRSDSAGWSLYMESQVQGSAGISVVILLGPVWAPNAWSSALCSQWALPKVSVLSLVQWNRTNSDVWSEFRIRVRYYFECHKISHRKLLTNDFPWRLSSSGMYPEDDILPSHRRENL